MLRHALDQHAGERLSEIEFGMEVIRSTRTSFERQILESVCIQQNTHHNILNSRSEYNRCSLPRLSTRLGDKEYKKYEKELEEEVRKEETLENRIREMRKNRNRNRRTRHQQTQPPAKRRKTGEETYTRTCRVWNPEWEEPVEQETEREDENLARTSSPRKRWEQEQEETPAPKRQKLSKIDVRYFVNQSLVTSRKQKKITGVGQWAKLNT